MHDAVTSPILEHRLRCHAPLVLTEELVHVRLEYGIRFLSDLPIRVKQSECGVTDSGPGRRMAAACVCEAELPVLIVGGTGDRTVYTDLIEIVFA